MSFDDDDLAPPAYLTSPGKAIAERKHWENQFERDIEKVLKGARTVTLPEPEPNALTASTVWVGWQTEVVDRLVEVLPPLPRWASMWLRDVAPEIADEVAPAPYRAMARRIAPTLATAAYNLHVLGWLARSGIPYKQWVTRRDNRVRPAHVATDWQVLPLSAPFVMGPSLLQYPGDATTALAEHYINCRCVLVGVEAVRETTTTVHAGFAR